MAGIDGKAVINEYFNAKNNVDSLAEAPWKNLRSQYFKDINCFNLLVKSLYLNSFYSFGTKRELRAIR